MKNSIKMLTLLLTALLLFSFIQGCTKIDSSKSPDDASPSQEEPVVPDPVDISKLSSVNSEDKIEYEQIVVGEMLPLTTRSIGASVLINNKGMSGLKAPNHLHAGYDSSIESEKRFAGESMYSTNNPDEIIFDVGSAEALGKMYIWNYNDIQHLDYGMQWIDLQYSTDNVNYTRLGTFALAKCIESDYKAYRGSMATNTVDENKPIDFGGIPARYIKIIPLTNWGGERFGLSEIRVFRHKTTPTKGEIIYSEAWENNSDNAAYNLVNNSGMSDLAGKPESVSCSNNPKDMWLTSNKDAAVIFNLDGTYPLDSMEIWNYNDPDALDNGAKKITVYYTVERPFKVSKRDDGTEYCDFTGGTWKKLGNYKLKKGTGKDGLSSSLTIDFDGIHAQHIKIVTKSNYGGDATGLSEVRFYSADGWAVEPSRSWTGLVSSSGMFPYQGNHSKTPFAHSNNGSGWIGADGIISTSLDGIRLAGSITDESKTLITFQDSFIGNFGNYRKFDHTDGYANSPGFSLGMKNMAYVYINGSAPDPRNVQWHLEMKNNGSENHPLYNIVNGSYWLGYSVLLNNSLYTIGGKFSGLSILGRDLLVTPLAEDGFPDLTTEAELIIHDKAGIIGGVEYESIYQEGDYIYQYGRKNSRLVVSRIAASDFASGKGYEFWNGSGWTTDHTKASRISDYEPGNEFNITYMTDGVFAGKYVNVYTEGHIWGQAAVGISDSITGPFKKADNLYFATEAYEVSRDSYPKSGVVFSQWNYNAKSQPALSSEGELLMTYHFQLQDDRVPPWGFFSAVAKEYEHPTFIRLMEIK